MNVDKEIDRILTLLRNKIRERGFTQLEVQAQLGWGRSYISQLLTKQKSLRVEQVLLILDVLGVQPAEFYGELYHYMPVDLSVRNLDDYAEALRSLAGSPASHVSEGPAAALGPSTGQLAENVEELRTMVNRLVQLLVDKKVVDSEELAAAAGWDEGDSPEGGTIQ